MATTLPADPTPRRGQSLDPGPAASFQPQATNASTTLTDLVLTPPDLESVVHETVGHDRLTAPSGGAGLPTTANQPTGEADRAGVGIAVVYVIAYLTMYIAL
ncbi:MAG: hypothetical protein LBG11_09615, partial [Bifidobacteriaceae bacterium]|nr:hypothetical protein [Bifidobacteriaceae bacterium]